MTAQQRRPAIQRPEHPAADLPSRQDAERTQSRTRKPADQPPARSGGAQDEKFSEPTNVKLRPSTRAALDRAVLLQQLRSGDRSHSIQSVVDQALNEFFDKHKLRDLP